MCSSMFRSFERSGLRELQEGQKVSFESKMDPRKGKPNAVNVKPARLEGDPT